MGRRHFKPEQIITVLRKSTTTPSDHTARWATVRHHRGRPTHLSCPYRLPNNEHTLSLCRWTRHRGLVSGSDSHTCRRVSRPASNRIEAQCDAPAELLLTSHGQRMVVHGSDIPHDAFDRMAAEEPGSADQLRRQFDGLLHRSGDQ